MYLINIKAILRIKSSFINRYIINFKLLDLKKNYKLKIKSEFTSIDLIDILNNVKLIDNRFILFSKHFRRSVAIFECI